MPHRTWPPQRRAARAPWLRFFVVVGLIAVPAAAPAAAPPQRPRVYAITDATLIVRPGETRSGTIVMRDGLIEAVGDATAVPADAEVIDGTGLTVYAAFIDAYSHLGMEARQGQGGGFNFAALLQGNPPQPGTAHPIELVHPQHRVTDELVASDGEVAKRREIGFGAALAAPRDGIFRGSSALIALRDGHPRETLILPSVTQHVGYDTGQFFGGYPTDIMGTVAAIRQVLYDTARYTEWRQRWLANPVMSRPDYNDAYEVIASAHADPARPIFHSPSNRHTELTMTLAAEFGSEPIILGTGLEYEIIELLRDQPVALIVPVDYPEAPDVSVAERLPSVSLQSLQRWEQAPGNAAALEAAGVTFALTPYGMGNAGRFIENVRTAIDKGLSADAALAALTTTPADLLGAANILGSLDVGKIANVVVSDGAPFDEDSEVRHVFVDGYHYEMDESETVGDPDATVDPRGEWAVTLTVMGNAQDATWTIAGQPGNYSGSSSSAQGDTDFESVDLAGNALTVSLAGPMGTMEATVVIEGDEFSGSTSIDAPGGQTITISLRGERTSGPEGGAR